ncbi:MAG TPA: PhzF family phenazine biosynthesis protein [Bryobacteraceae bacterium]|jgi:trans-2,3-dihydro-3-hydroxyanthranilate isomerase|nr:PhzF family phenazine biosynthesis protein [Bryobacteraceae bacterium]
MPETVPYRYCVVDVFTREPLEGNPLAVFPSAAGIPEHRLQQIARELNLSETVFVYDPTTDGCAARLRIFTPAREVPFAGHPTVGSSFVLWQTRRVPTDATHFQLEEKIGIVPIRVEHEHGERPLIWLTTPPITFGKTLDPVACAEALGISPKDLLPVKPQFVSAGNPMAMIAVRTKDVVDRSWLGMENSRKLSGLSDGPAGFFVFTPTQEGAYSRMFAPEHGVTEDPATGSATGPLAAYMARYELCQPSAGTRLISEQGTQMGRRSLLHIQFNDDAGKNGIEIGGYVTPIIDGAIMQVPSN